MQTVSSPAFRTVAVSNIAWLLRIDGLETHKENPQLRQETATGLMAVLVSRSPSGLC